MRITVASSTTNPVVVTKWQAIDGTLFGYAMECICYNVLCAIEEQANKLFSNSCTNTPLLDVFHEIQRFFEEDVHEIFQSEKTQQLLAQDPYAHKQETYSNWLSSCKAHVKSAIEELTKSGAGTLTRESGLVIEHWQCSTNACYSVYNFKIVSPRGSHFMHFTFSAGGRPYQDRDWPGYYCSDLGLPDLCRHWQQTQKRNAVVA